MRDVINVLFVQRDDLKKVNAVTYDRPIWSNLQTLNHFMKSTLKSLLVGITLCSTTAFAQNPFYWQQYNSYNPGAAGIDDSLAFISNVNFNGSYFSSRASVNYRSKKLHGGLSAGYTGLSNRDWYANNGLNLNYSFHAKLGEKSTLGIGAGFNYNNIRYLQNGSISQEENAYEGTLGVHFQSGRFRAGTTFTARFAENEPRYQLSWSSLYADYTFKLGEKWGLQTGLAAGYDFRYLTLTAKYKDKLWFGTNLNFYNPNVFAGYKFKQGITLGASVGFYNYGSHTSFSGSVLLKADLHKVFGRK